MVLNYLAKHLAPAILSPFEGYADEIVLNDYLWVSVTITPLETEGMNYALEELREICRANIMEGFHPCGSEGRVGSKIASKVMDQIRKDYGL
jgi:hypothetical protein